MDSQNGKTKALSRPSNSKKKERKENPSSTGHCKLCAVKWLLEGGSERCDGRTEFGMVDSACQKNTARTMAVFSFVWLFVPRFKPRGSGCSVVYSLVIYIYIFFTQMSWVTAVRGNLKIAFHSWTINRTSKYKYVEMCFCTVQPVISTELPYICI